ENARCRILDPEAQGIGDPASRRRAPDGSGRALCAALPARYRRRQRAADRARLCRATGADLFQLAQDLDLRRLERDPEEHNLESDPGTLRGRPREPRWIST